MTCRECWDPAPEGQELCDWCAMTPEQRSRRTWISGILAALALAAIFGALYLAERESANVATAEVSS